MGAKGRARKRRSSAEWEALVEEWERSGMDGEVFAAQRGVDRQRLVWWRWRLSKGRGAKADALRLVRVDVQAPAPVSTKDMTVPRRSWEVTTGRGQLIVHEGIGPSELGAVLAALLGR